MASENDKTRSLSCLDVLNFTAADIGNAFGPFLSIYLLHDRHWNAAQIGGVMSAQSIAAITTQAPLSAWIDTVQQKRQVIAVASLLVAGAMWMMVHTTAYWIVVASQIFVGAVWVVYQPTLVAISRGIVGPKTLSGRLGRNEIFNHIGNVTSSVLSGFLGKLLGFVSIFNLMALQGLLAAGAVLGIRQQDINHDWARGCDEGKAQQHESKAESFLHVFKDSRLMIFTMSILLFHFANAAMLPLLGQVLAVHQARWASVSIAACVTIAQVVMIPVAFFSSRLARSWGRKPVFAIGFGILMLRGILYTLNANPFYLLRVEALDGIGAGIYGVLGGLVASDLAQGTGRFNFIQGIVITALGIGCALSNGVAGWVAKTWGYSVGFLFLAGVACVGLVFFMILMPETKWENLLKSSSN